MGVYSMRSGKDAVMFRIALVAHNCGITPNILTSFGLLFGVSCGILVAVRALPLAFAFGVLSVFCDVLDGTLARKFHLESKFGLAFDSVADRTAESAVVLGALAGGIIQPLGLAAIAGSMSLLVLRIASFSYNLKTDYVLFGRFERLLFILAGLLSPIAWLSTCCFAIAGAFGLISSVQIACFLHKSKLHRKS